MPEHTSIQVRPAYFDEDGGVVSQPGGPDERTTFWAVYGRNPDGTVSWLADYDDEESARKGAQGFAELYGVEVEGAR